MSQWGPLGWVLTAATRVRHLPAVLSPIPSSLSHSIMKHHFFNKTVPVKGPSRRLQPAPDPRLWPSVSRWGWWSRPRPLWRPCSSTLGPGTSGTDSCWTTWASAGYAFLTSFPGLTLPVLLLYLVSPYLSGQFFLLWISSGFAQSSVYLKLTDKCLHYLEGFLS